MSDQVELGRILALLREGKLPEAEAACREILTRSPRSAPAIHLLALIRKDSGDLSGGEQLMRESIESWTRKMPTSSQFRQPAASRGSIAGSRTVVPSGTGARCTASGSAFRPGADAERSAPARRRGG